jgi:hypothetical protein
MPTPTLTPQMVLQEQYRKLQTETKAKEAAFPKSDPELYAKHIQGLQKEFDKRKAEIFSQGEQFDQVDMMVQAGLMDPQAADETKWRMVLPTDIAKNMVHPGAQGTPMSPGSLTNKAMVGSIGQFSQAAPEQAVGKFFSTSPIQNLKDWFTPNYRSQSDLVKQYRAWRDFVGYEVRPPVQQRQLDIQWDDMLAADKKNKWNPKSPEISALRAKGSISRAAAAQVMPGTPMSGIPKTSPFIDHVNEQKPAPEKIEVMRPDGTPVKVPKTEWLQQRDIALSEGWKEV